MSLPNYTARRALIIISFVAYMAIEILISTTFFGGELMQPLAPRIYGFLAIIGISFQALSPLHFDRLRQRRLFKDLDSDRPFIVLMAAGHVVLQQLDYDLPIFHTQRIVSLLFGLVMLAIIVSILLTWPKKPIASFA